ncbi:MAG: hypothetical protein OCD01_09905 [Fibrobacterales bacterium]
MQDLINKVYDHVESGEIDKAVFTCVRLARKCKDTFSTVIFLRELTTDERQLQTALYDEIRLFKKEAQKYAWDKSYEMWLEERELDFDINMNDGPKSILKSGIGDLQKQVKQDQDRITAIQLPAGLSADSYEYELGRIDHFRSILSLKISGEYTVIERIRTRCFLYASRIERERAGQSKTEPFLTAIQQKVNNYFNHHSEDVYNKIQKAQNLIDSDNPEDFALLLTSVRRAMHAVADHFYPPQKDLVVCADGVKRELGNEQYLNRIEEFCIIKISKSASKDLIKQEVKYLTTFFRRLNDVASKGVHTDVSKNEAKQGLVGLYMFLSNLIHKLEIEAE